MSEKFDFGKIGTKMPYTVPDGFFPDMEKKVLAQIAAESALSNNRQVGKRNVFLRLMIKTAMTVAATVAILFVVRSSFSPVSATDWNCVEQAFDNLTPVDQDLLIDTYQNDVFMDD